MLTFQPLPSVRLLPSADRARIPREFKLSSILSRRTDSVLDRSDNAFYYSYVGEKERKVQSIYDVHPRRKLI